MLPQVHTHLDTHTHIGMHIILATQDQLIPADVYVL